MEAFRTYGAGSEAGVVAIAEAEASVVAHLKGLPGVLQGEGLADSGPALLSNDKTQCSSVTFLLSIDSDL